MEIEIITREEYMQLIDLLKIQFDKIDERFDNLEERINERFDTVEQRLDYHDIRFNDLEKRLSEKVDKKDFKTLITVLKAGNVINRHEADHFLIPVS